MLGRHNIHELPTFNNHIEAKEYFKKRYGEQFVDTKITTVSQTNNKKYLCYIKITEKVVRLFRIAENGDIELVD